MPKSWYTDTSNLSISDSRAASPSRLQSTQNLRQSQSHSQSHPSSQSQYPAPNQPFSHRPPSLASSRASFGPGFSSTNQESHPVSLHESRLDSESHYQSQSHFQLRPQFTKSVITLWPAIPCSSEKNMNEPIGASNLPNMSSVPHYTNPYYDVDQPHMNDNGVAPPPHPSPSGILASQTQKQAEDMEQQMRGGMHEHMANQMAMPLTTSVPQMPIYYPYFEYQKFPVGLSSSSQSTFQTCSTPIVSPPSNFKPGIDLGVSTAPSNVREDPTIPPRGIYHPGKTSIPWLPSMQKILNYTFANPDLLEEALESPDSGIYTVGHSHTSRSLGRHGNTRLANVGESAIRLVLSTQAYNSNTHPVTADERICKILERTNLDRVGRESGIERFVRRPKSRVVERKGILGLGRMVVGELVDNSKVFKGEEPSRWCVRGVKAVLGAVYLDGGIGECERVLEALKVGF